MILSNHFEQPYFYIRDLFGAFCVNRGVKFNRYYLFIIIIYYVLLYHFHKLNTNVDDVF